MKSECRRRARASRSPSPDESVDEDCVRHRKAHRSAAASRKDDAKDDGDANALSRRPAWFWAEFNQWWREEQARLGKRPGKPSIMQWYKKNATTVWQQDTPTFTETRLHAKCLRTTEAVRDYFRRYRAARKEQQQQLNHGSSGGGACDGSATPSKGHPRAHAVGPHAHGHHPHSATAAEEPPMDPAALIAEHNRRILEQQRQQQQAQGRQHCWWQPPGMPGPQLQPPRPQMGIAPHCGSPSAAAAAAPLPVAAMAPAIAPATAPAIAPATAPALGGAGGVCAGADVCVHGRPHQHPYEQQEERRAGCGSRRQAKATANSTAPPRQMNNLVGADFAPLAPVPVRTVVLTTALHGPSDLAKPRQPTTEGTSNVPSAEGPAVAATPPPLLTDLAGCGSTIAPDAHASGRSSSAALLPPAPAPAPCPAAAALTTAAIAAATAAGAAAAAAVPIAACLDDTASGEDEDGSLRSHSIGWVGGPTDGGGTFLLSAERGRGSTDGGAPCGGPSNGQDARLRSSAGGGDAAEAAGYVEAGGSRQPSAGGGSLRQDCSGTDLDDDGRCSPLPPSCAERLYRPLQQHEYQQHQHQHQHQQFIITMMQQEQHQQQQRSQPWQAESEQLQQQLRLRHLQQQLLWHQTAHPVWQRLPLQLPQQRPLPPSAALWPSSAVAAGIPHNSSYGVLYDSLIGAGSGPGSCGLARMQPPQASAFVHSGRMGGLAREGELKQGPLRLIPTPSMPCARPTMEAAPMALRGMLPAWQEMDELYDNGDDDDDDDDSCVPEVFWD